MTSLSRGKQIQFIISGVGKNKLYYWVKEDIDMNTRNQNETGHLITDNVNRKQLEEAIAALGQVDKIEWSDCHTGEKDKDGNEILTFPYPFYPPEIFPVFGYLESDYNYIENYKNNCKNTPIEKMNLSQIRTMFTWLVQNERFCDGFIADEIENGNLLALFRRLNELVGDEK